MKRNLLLTVAAAVCLTCPATAPADPPQSGRDAQAQPQKPAKGQGGPAGGQHGGAAGPGAAAVHVGQATTGQFQAGRGGSGGQGVTGVQAQVRVKSLHVQGGSQGSQAGAVTGSTGRPNFSSVSRSSFTGQVQQDAGQTVRHQALVRQLTRPPANVPVLSGWTRGVTGPARDQQDQQWRQAHTGWDSGAPWRSNQNWWRGNVAFRLFAGERPGFFFIPELGYVSVPTEYRDHYWRVGDQLPDWFWRYQVRDYWTYDLPQPPDGCIWVWVDNDVALIDASDGYIIDIVHNAW